MTRLRGLAARHPSGAALLVALALLLVPYRTLLGPGVPSGRDLVPYFYPLKTQLVEALRAGEMPWVDRFRQGGLPLLAAPGTGAFDPGNLLFLLLPTGAAAKAWMLLRVVSGAAGFAVFLRLAGLPPLSSALGGLAWGASGITASSASFLGFASAHAALPWFAASLLGVRARRSARSAVLLAVATALLLVASVPEPVVAAAILALVLLARRGAEPGLRERASTVALWGAAGLLGVLLAAPAVATYLVTGLEGIRGERGSLLPAFAAQGSLPLARLPDLVADGAVADWTRVVRSAGIPDYPYFPSSTPGRVAWTLALLGLVAGRRAALAPVATAAVGVLLALGPATPVFRLFVEAFPLAASIRYPEKYAVLFGFGVVWLAAVGAAAIEGVLHETRARPAFAFLALLLAADRAAITPRLIPLAPEAILTERPALLASLPAPRRGEPPPRVLHWASYRSAVSIGADDPGETGAALTRWAFPSSGSRFGVATVFERDYDVSLPRPQLEWVLFLESSPPGAPAPVPLARAAGAAAIVEGARRADGRGGPLLRRVPGPVSPYRLVDRVIRDEDPRRLATRFLAEGAPPDAAFVTGPGESAAAAAGRVVRVSDRPSGLELDVEGKGPGSSYLLVCRPLVATRRASLDGRPVRVEDANVGFSALAVPPGRHVVRLRPDGRWLIIAAVLTTLGAAIAAVLVLRRDAGVAR